MLYLELTYMFLEWLFTPDQDAIYLTKQESWGSLMEAAQMRPSKLGQIYQIERSKVAWEQGKQGRIEARVHLCTEKMNFF